jgi:DNA-binding NtrC family response regulator
MFTGHGTIETASSASSMAYEYLTAGTHELEMLLDKAYDKTAQAGEHNLKLEVSKVENQWIVGKSQDPEGAGYGQALGAHR